MYPATQRDTLENLNLALFSRTLDVVWNMQAECHSHFFYQVVSIFLARFELIYTYVTMSYWHCCLISLLLYKTIISGQVFRTVHNLLKLNLFSDEGLSEGARALSQSQ